MRITEGRHSRLRRCGLDQVPYQPRDGSLGAEVVYELRVEPPQLLQQLILLEEVLEIILSGVEQILQGALEREDPRRPDVPPSPFIEERHGGLGWAGPGWGACNNYIFGSFSGRICRLNPTKLGRLFCGITRPPQRGPQRLRSLIQCNDTLPISVASCAWREVTGCRNGQLTTHEVLCVK